MALPSVTSFVEVMLYDLLGGGVIMGVGQWLERVAPELVVFLRVTQGSKRKTLYKWHLRVVKA